MKSRLGRVALEVADVDAAAAEFAKLFDMEFSTFDIPAQSLRVAYGEHGIEFVQVTADGWQPREAGLMQGCCIAVDDVEAQRAHMLANGQEVVMEIPLQSGRKEYVFKPIHGVPVMIYQHSEQFDLIAQ